MVIAGGVDERPHRRLRRRDASTEPAMVIAGGSVGGLAALPPIIMLQRSRRW